MLKCILFLAPFVPFSFRLYISVVLLLFNSKTLYDLFGKCTIIAWYFTYIYQNVPKTNNLIIIETLNSYHISFYLYTFEMANGLISMAKENVKETRVNCRWKIQNTKYIITSFSVAERLSHAYYTVDLELIWPFHSTKTQLLVVLFIFTSHSIWSSFNLFVP